MIGRRTFRTPTAAPVLCLLTLALLSGCGGGEKADQNAGKAGGELKPRQQVQAPAAQQPAEAAPGARQAPSAPAKPESPAAPAIDPSVNPNDVFQVVAASPTYELSDDGGTTSADVFAVSVPPPGVTSAHFELVNPPKQEVMPERRKPVSPDATAPRNALTPRKTTASRDSLRPRSTKPARETPGTPGITPRGEKPKRSKPPKLVKKPEIEPQDTDAGPPALPDGFRPIPGSGQSKLGLPLRIRGERDGAEMALVTGGASVLGHDGDPPESAPPVNVVLDSFYMDVTEVTVGQFRSFRDEEKSEKGRSSAPEPTNASAPADFPVLGVTLAHAQFYAHWAGKELPTEAEWERADRGEANFDHPWGNGRAIWKQAREPRDIGPVKAFATDRSPYGIFDLAGNAREWCVDRYSPDAFAAAFKLPPGQLRNWKGPRVGEPESFHVVKGNGPQWNAWHREGRNSFQRQPDVGFRCVLRLSGKSS